MHVSPDQYQHLYLRPILKYSISIGSMKRVTCHNESRTSDVEVNNVKFLVTDIKTSAFAVITFSTKYFQDRIDVRNLFVVNDLQRSSIAMTRILVSRLFEYIFQICFSFGLTKARFSKYLLTCYL